MTLIFLLMMRSRMFLTVWRSKQPAAIDGSRQEVGFRRRFHQLEMRILEIIEADNIVSAAQPIRFRGQIQDHLLCAV